MSQAVPVLETGVPNLDFVLGGGIPETDTLLVSGAPGTGKTILSLQILFHQARAGRNVLYVSLVSESPLRLIRHLRTLSFFDERLIGSHVFLLNVFDRISDSLVQITAAVREQIREHEVTVLALDGFDAIRDHHSNTSDMREFLFQLLTMLAGEQVTTIITTGPIEPPSNAVEQTMVDGIIAFSHENVGNHTIRYLSCSKMRAMSNVSGRHAMKIDANGVTVFPRFESTYIARDVPLGDERVAFGLPALDALMAGGPRAGGSVMVAGAVGTGKTLMSLQYLREGSRRGERCLFVGFREAPRELLRLAEQVGMDLESAVVTGKLVLLYRAPVELLVDEVTDAIVKEVVRLRPHRLVIDSVDEIERAVLPAQRRWDYLVALAGWLHGEGVTTLFTREISQLVGTELDFAETPLASLATNLFLLRWVEFHGDLFRILSILKMRGSAFDSSIRQYLIESSGIRVLQKVEAAEGLLTGIARGASVRRPRAGQSSRPSDDG